MKIFKIPNKQITEIIDYYYNAYKLSTELIEKKNNKRSIKKSKLVEIQLPKFNYFSQTINKNTDSESESDENQVDFDFENYEKEDSRYSKICISCQKLKKLSLFYRYINHDSIKELNDYHSNITTKEGLSSLNITNANSQKNSNSQNNSFLMMEKSSQYLLNYNLNSMNQNKLSFEQLNNQEKNNHDFEFKIENLCNQCWIYWKQYGEFKYTYYYETSSNKNINLERPCPEKRQDRLNAIRSQLNYKCYIDNCNKEFKLKEEFINHSLICHCLLVKKALLNAKSKYQNLHNFYLRITSFNKAICVLYNKIKPKYFKSLARNPFKEIVDGNSLLNECKPIIQYFILLIILLTIFILNN